MEPGSGCRWSTGSSRCTTARSKCNPRPAVARRLRCCCRRRSEEMLNSECRMQNSGCGTSAMTRRSLWRRVLVLPAFCILHSALLLSLTACGTKAKAQTLPDGPPLAVPMAPAHDIVVEQIAAAPPAPEQPEPVPEPDVTAKPTTTKIPTAA